MISRKTCILLLVLLIIILVLAGYVIGPIKQPNAYHDFADKRSFLGLANAWNVFSNISFFVAGIWGLYLLCSAKKIQFVDNRQRWPWVLVSIGLILTSLGSSYYHHRPNNFSLAWDRLPMAIVFTSYIAALISERLGVRWGLILWPILSAVGLWSVLLWLRGEYDGDGDLRFYLSMQMFCLCGSLILMLVPSPYTRSYDISIVASLYVIAIFLEKFDKPIYEYTKAIISGHSLKHAAGALAGAWIVRMLWKRKIIKGERRRVV